MPECTSKKIGRPARSPWRPVPALLILSFVFSACQTYRDATTYFNVYYDARRHLDMYEEKLAEPPPPQNGAIATITTHRWLDEEYESRRYALVRTGNVPVVKTSLKPNAELSSRSGDTKHLDSAVILGSKILADKHPSAYVEDALFVVGKALYYKNDFSGAKRKFNEMLFKFPQTKYGPEVGRLLTRTLLQTRQYDSATKSIILSLSRAEATGTKEDKAEAHKLYADLLVAKNPENLTSAAEQLAEAEKLVSDDEAAKLAFERGSLYYLDGKWSEAESAFADAVSKSSDAETQGESKVAHALAMRRKEQFVEAKAELKEVLEKTRYSLSHPPAQFEYTYTIELEARHANKGRLTDAHFKTKLYPDVRAAYFVLDTTYHNTSQAIMVRSRFRQAELYRGMGEYDSAAHLANSFVGTKDFSTPEINDYVNERMRALMRFAEMRTVLSRSSKLERLLERSRSSGGDMVATMKRGIRTEAERLVLGAQWSPDGRATPTPEQELLIKETEGKITHERELSGNSVSALRISDTVKFVDSLRFIQAKAHFEIGRSYETFTEQYNALSEYRQAFEVAFVLPDTAKNIFGARTLFTWIELDHQMKNVTERDSLIAILQRDFGETVFAAQAGILYSGQRDKESAGEKAYSDAYRTLKNGIEQGAQQLRQVSTTYNHEDVSPRSLYAIGIAYEEKGRIDSAVFYYRRVLHEYPFSKYADEIRPRLAFAASVQQSQTKLPPNVIMQPMQTVGTPPPSSPPPTPHEEPPGNDQNLEDPK